MKKIISTLCAAAMICSLAIAPATAAETVTVKPQTKTLLNVANAKPVYSSSMLDYVATSQTYAVDENAKTVTGADYSYWAPAADDASPWIIVDLTQEYTFKTLDVQVFPKTNFIVSASKDMNSWTVIHQQGNDEWQSFANGIEMLRINLNAAESYRYVKISRPEGFGGEGFQVADIAVYAPYHTNQINVAKGRGSAYIQGGRTDIDWLHVDRLTNNGVQNDFAYAAYDPNKKSYFTIDLGKAYDINYIEIVKSYNYNGFTAENGTTNNIEIYGANVGGDAETLQADASAELAGSYKGRNAAGEAVDFGPQWSKIRIDTNFSEPKRYIQVAHDDIGANRLELALGEVRVFTDNGEVETTASLEEIFKGKPSSAAGPADLEHYFGVLQDGDENNTWTSNLAEGRSFYGVDLTAFYNIRKIEIIAANEAAYNNYEIWGGETNGAQSYANGFNMQLLAAQGSEGGSAHMIFDVEHFNNTRYFTFVSKAEGQSIKGIKVWVEADGQYADVSTGKKAALSSMTNGNPSVFDMAVYSEGIEGLQGGQMYAEAGDAYVPADSAYFGLPAMCRYWIDLGKPTRIDILRTYARNDGYFSAEGAIGYTVWGSNELTSGWEQITTVQENKPMYFRHSEVKINTPEKYRYIGIAKSFNDTKAGIFGGTYINANTFLDLSEIVVYSKNRPIPVKNATPFASVVTPTEDENVAKIFDGDAATAYTGDYAEIDLGEAYVVEKFEAIGGGAGLALYGYTDSVDNATALTAGGSYRYIVIGDAVELAELKIYTDAEKISKDAAISCRFQDNATAHGNEIVALDAATLGAEINVCNVTKDAIGANVFLALYDNEGKLLAVNLASDTISAFEGKKLITGFANPGGIAKDYELKAFVWKNGNAPYEPAFSLVQG